MTQKQLIDQFCEFRGKCTTEDVVALTYAYKSLQLDFIDKACDWLYEYNRKQVDKMFGTVHTADVTINVADFRKAMKGE